MLQEARTNGNDSAGHCLYAAGGETSSFRGALEVLVEAVLFRPREA